jgi:ABC-type bacteriocin/lantibiotic exporter with double-glycine peptidase domain
MGMGLYDEQILSRIKNDRDAFDESFFRLASVVTGDKRADTFLSDREKAKNAIEDILKYFHIVPVAVPDEIENVDDQLEFLLRPSGIMRRRVELVSNWYKEGAGPLLGATADGNIIALIPGKFSGYSFYDHTTGKNIKVTRKIAEEIEIDAYCFYKPMPLRKLSFSDLIKYMASSVAASDIVMIVAATFAVTMLGMITPYATRLIFTSVIASGKMFQLLSVAVLLAGAALSTALINITSTILIARIGAKIDISVQSAAMSRVLALPASFFKEYSAGDLAQRLQNLNQICGAMSGIFIKTMLSAVFSLLYLGQIAAFAPSLVLPALGIIISGLVFAVISTFVSIKVARKEMAAKGKLSGLIFALFSGVQKIRLQAANSARSANGQERMKKWQDANLLLRF